MLRNEQLKKSFFWANLTVLIFYFASVWFEDINGQIFKLPVETILDVIVFSGIILSLLNLWFDSKRWLVPSISLVLYLWLILG